MRKSYSSSSTYSTSQAYEVVVDVDVDEEEVSVDVNYVYHAVLLYRIFPSPNFVVVRPIMRNFRMLYST